MRRSFEIDHRELVGAVERGRLSEQDIYGIVDQKGRRELARFQFAGDPDGAVVARENDRQDVRREEPGVADAFAGRGASINEAIASYNPFFHYQTPVIQNLADPRKDLDQFFRALGRAYAEAYPVATAQAEVYTHMSDTF